MNNFSLNSMEYYFREKQKAYLLTKLTHSYLYSFGLEKYKKYVDRILNLILVNLKLFKEHLLL